MAKQSQQYTPGVLYPSEKSQNQDNEVLQRYLDLTFNNREELFTHNSYEQELREQKSIETGNIEMLERCWNELQPHSYGALSKDRIRNAKNHCIILVAFASRAAIRGGIPPELAYSLCDSYCQEIEDCNDSSILAQLARRAEMRFTKLVIEANTFKEHQNSNVSFFHVERCKNYIFSHLHEKLTVKDIADAMHLNANYLSGLFQKSEGQSILQFILKEKIKLVQNMLIYSNYTHSEIAAYLGFSSQSHLGYQFKKNMNMTLREFRSKYQSKNFQRPEETEL